MKKLILHIPHASTHIPSKQGYVIDDALIQNEILKLTDWHTDDLFSNSHDDCCIAPFSRIFCDVERFPNDADEVMAKFGMGMIYEKTDSGTTMREVTAELRNSILHDHYLPHHQKLITLVNQELHRNEKALIVDCHSFPHLPNIRALDQTDFRPDFNIGFDTFHCNENLVQEVQTFLEAKGYVVGINRPYSGSLVPQPWYLKDDSVQSIMLEVNRKLYLKENTQQKSTSYEKTKKTTQEFLNILRNSTYS